MRGHKREGHRWFKSVKPKDLRKVLRLIRRDGALTIRDIDDDVLQDKQHLWASRKPSKRALELAFFPGALAISERNGMLKTYDLMTRHFGWDKPPKPASATEITAYLLDRALRAQGSSVSIRSAISMRRARRRCATDPGARPPRRTGARRDRRRRQAAALGAAGDVGGRGRGRTDLVHILSPFDPLIIQRKRTNCFSTTTTSSRRMCRRRSGMFGYFALPVLVGDRIVAALDLKTDRRTENC